MSHPAEASNVAAAAQTSQARADVAGRILNIEAGGQSVELLLPDGDPDTEDDIDWDDLDFRRAFPGRARGDQRELLLAAALQDAEPAAGTRESDERLREALAEPGTIPAADAQSRNVLAEVLADQYWISPSRTGFGGGRRPAVFPIHSALPINFSQRGRYKMFRGDFLLFFCWTGSGFDEEAIQQLFDLMNLREELSMLDALMIEGALNAAGQDGIDHADPQGLLAGGQAVKVREALDGLGPYCPEPMARFREDIRTALSMPLPRHDRVEAVILTMSLHLALYYYEIAFRLGQDLERIEAITAGQDDPLTRSFDGALRFRIGTAGDRPVRRIDGCAESWRELDDRYLIALSANILTANVLHALWSAAGGASAEADPGALADALRQDPDLRRTIDTGARVLAVLYASRAGQGTSEEELAEIAAAANGVPALRSTILRHRVRSLKHLGRDVVNRLVNTGLAGSLRRTRGNVRFFELDEAFLFLLVKFTIARSGEPELLYEAFLARLAEYGLAPQDEDERDQLASALERLGMLHRYSDAGEAVYVRHLL